MMKQVTGLTSLLFLSTTCAFTITPHSPLTSPHDIMATSTTQLMESTIVSPFDSTSVVPGMPHHEPLELTWENVETVLDDMRPFLIQDGGNVTIREIDGPIVKLELIGACGTCPSSAQTLRMGLERGLRDCFPDIEQVIQVQPESPPLTEDEVNVVLDGVRPFLHVAGGAIEVDKVVDESLQPTIWLNMKGASASLNSVKLEIAERLRRNFLLPGLHVEWINSL